MASASSLSAGLHQGSDLMARGVSLLIDFVGLADDTPSLAIDLGKTVENVSLEQPRVCSALTHRLEIFPYITQINIKSRGE